MMPLTPLHYDVINPLHYDVTNLSAMMLLTPLRYDVINLFTILHDPLRSPFCTPLSSLLWRYK